MTHGSTSLLGDHEIFTLHHRLGTVMYQLTTKELPVSEIIEYVVKSEKNVLVDEHTANKLATALYPPSFSRLEYNDSLRHSFFILLNKDDNTRGRLCRIINHDIRTTSQLGPGGVTYPPIGSLDQEEFLPTFNVNKQIVTSYPINTVVLYDTSKNGDPLATKMCKVIGYVENHDDKERPGVLYLDLVDLPKLINEQVINGGSYFAKHTDVIKMRN